MTKLSSLYLIKHSGRTLLDHLEGTASLLKKMGASEDVISAGRYHSVYKFCKYDDREEIRGLIGEEAERLVYLFCKWDRKLDTVSGASDNDMVALKLIEQANRLEQDHRLKH